MWSSQNNNKQQHQYEHEVPTSATTIPLNSSSTQPIPRKMTKLGPPQYIKPRPYSSILEELERHSNLTLIAEYEEDVYTHFVELEQLSAINPKMIDLQPEIEWYMRPYLLDFLIEMHTSFKLKSQTLFLCLNIIDRYCSRRIVFKQHYQLIGCTAMWMAAKYEDKKSRTPTLRELSMMCRNVYDENMFKEMEMHILSTLDWSLGHVSLEDCLQLSIKTAKLNSPFSSPQRQQQQNSHSKSIENAIIAISRYLCELSLFQRAFLVYPTSLVAITAHLIACSFINDRSAAKLLLRISEDYEYENQFGDIKSEFHHHHHSSKSETINLFGDYSSSEDDDEEMFDENSENTKPTPKLPFISGFLGSKTVFQIRQISLLFINALNNPSEILVNKYTPLGVINVVNGFLQKNYTILQQSITLMNSEDLKIEELSASTFNIQLHQLSDLLLGLSSVLPLLSTFTQPRPVTSNVTYSPSLPPLTPSSSSSQYSSSSVFSSGMKTPTASMINIKNLSSRQNSTKSEYNHYQQQQPQKQKQQQQQQYQIHQGHQAKRINYPNSSPVADLQYPSSSPVVEVGKRYSDNAIQNQDEKSHPICYGKFSNDPVSSPLSHHSRNNQSMIY